jgi:hypothetical protein
LVARWILDSATITSVRCRTSLLVALALANCSSPRQTAEHEWTPVPSPDLGDVVARVGRVPIFAKQVEAQSKKTGTPMRTALEALVAANLLAEVARGQGHVLASARDPEVQSALVQRLLEKELEPNLRPEATPDNDLRPLYERARQSFVHSRLVEIGLLAVYTGAPMQKEDRELREQTARELASYLKKQPAKTLDEFSAIARDPAWSNRKVVFNRFLQSTDSPLSKTVGAEVAKLRAPGDTTPLVVDVDGSFIARYIGERSGEDITFDQVRPKLLAGYYEHWRRKQFLEFTTQLGRLHHVEVHLDSLPKDE